MHDNYRRYLRTRAWREKRDEILEYYDHICMYCGKKATQVHHRNYKRCFGKERMSDLEPLCKKCHKMIHGVF